jgi:hypothetical protein
MNTEWNPKAKSASIRKWADNLHKESKRLFLQDKTHAHLLFFFDGDKGLISVNPVPPKTAQAKIDVSIARAVKDNKLFGVIFVGEAWAYFRKGKTDHTAFQLLDGEMTVKDLRDEDKTEVLYMRMESLEKDSLVRLNRIIRTEDEVALSPDKKVWGEDQKWFPASD